MASKVGEMMAQLLENRQKNNYCTCLGGQGRVRALDLLPVLEGEWRSGSRKLARSYL